MSTYFPDTSGDLVAAMDCPDSPGAQRLHDLVGWVVGPDGKKPVVATQHGRTRTLAVGEPYEVIPVARADDFDVAGWKSFTFQTMEAAREKSEAEHLDAEMWADICRDYVVAETVPPQDPRMTAKRRAVGESWGHKGLARPIGKDESLTGTRNQPVAKISRRVWVLNSKVGDFIPEPAGSTVLIVGADGLADGRHRLVGMVGGHPAVLVLETAQLPKVVVARGGRWKRPGSEDPQRWIEVARADLAREAEQSPGDIRALMLNRLAAEFVITPASDGERIVLEVLVSEGYARRIRDSYALDREVDCDVP